MHFMHFKMHMARVITVVPKVLFLIIRNIMFIHLDSKLEVFIDVFFFKHQTSFLNLKKGLKGRVCPKMKMFVCKPVCICFFFYY